MKTKLFYPTAILLLLLNSFYCEAQLGPVTAYVAGKQVRAIIKDVDDLVGKTMNNATIVGDGLISKAANELQVTAQNTMLLLDKQLDKRFEDLDTETQKIVLQMASLKLSLENTVSSAYDIKDALVIDLRSVFGDVLPWSKTNFFVQKIGGLAQITNFEEDYSLKILGIGFGIDNDKQRSYVKSIETKGGAKIKFVENKFAANQSEIKLSYVELNKIVNESKPTLIDLILTVNISNYKGFIFKS